MGNLERDKIKYHFKEVLSLRDVIMRHLQIIDNINTKTVDNNPSDTKSTSSTTLGEDTKKSIVLYEGVTMSVLLFGYVFTELEKYIKDYI